MTRKQQVLIILSRSENGLTCAEICNRIVKESDLTGNVAHYLSGSVSSILNKFVKEGKVKYSDKKGPKGGYVYEYLNICYKLKEPCKYNCAGLCKESY